MIPGRIDFNVVYKKFVEKKRVYDHQEKIEARKNQCMVCNFGREGTNTLVEIVERLDKINA